jgi:hypothetical protein
VRKQIILLLGLVLIATVGLAAGIEASKGNWDYRSLLQAPGALRNTRATLPAPLSSAQPVATSPAQAKYPQHESPPSPFVQFTFDRLEGQRGLTGDLPACQPVTAQDKTALKVSLSMGCAEDVTEGERDDAIVPQTPVPPSERASGSADPLPVIG